MMDRVKRISIIGTETVGDFTMYTIGVVLADASWEVKRRYSEFRQLHAELVRSCGVRSDALPGKHYIGSLRKSVVEDRRNGFDRYLNHLKEKLNPTPRILLQFLQFQVHDPISITFELARFLFTHGDKLVVSGQPVRLSAMQVFASTRRLQCVAPTTECDDPATDIGHLYDVICFLKDVEIIGHGARLLDNRKTMPQDLSIFKSLELLGLDNCCLDQMQFAPSLLDNLHTLSVHRSISSCRELLLHWPARCFDQPDSSGSPWNGLTRLDLRHNKLPAIDSSVQLLVNVKHLDVSHNRIATIEHLQYMPALRWLDMSHNELNNLHDLHLRLGNIYTLILRHNSITSLEGLSRQFSLQILDVADNNINKFSEVIPPLARLPELESLTLTGNPLTTLPDYRLFIFRGLPNRIVLDKKAKTPQETRRAAKASQARLESFATVQSTPRGTSNSLPASPVQEDIVVAPVRGKVLGAKKSHRATSSTAAGASAAAPKPSTDATAAPDRRNSCYDEGATSFRERLEALRLEGGDSWLEMLNDISPVQVPEKAAGVALTPAQESRTPFRLHRSLSVAAVPLTGAVLQAVCRKYSQNFRSFIMKAADEAQSSHKTGNFLVQCNDMQVICSVDVQHSRLLEVNLTTGQPNKHYMLTSLQALSADEESLQLQIIARADGISRSDSTDGQQEEAPVSGHIDSPGDRKETEGESSKNDTPELYKTVYALPNLQQLAKLLVLLLPWSLAADSSSLSLMDSSAASYFPVITVHNQTLPWQEGEPLPGLNSTCLQSFFMSAVAGRLGVPYEQLQLAIWSDCQRHGTDSEVPCCVLVTTCAVHVLEVSAINKSGLLMRWLVSCLLSQVTTISVGLLDMSLRLEALAGAALGPCSFSILTRDPPTTEALVAQLRLALAAATAGKALASPDAGATPMEDLMTVLRDSAKKPVGSLLVYMPLRLISVCPGVGSLPVTLVLTERFAFLVDEDYTHWPCLSWSSAAPSTPRYSVIGSSPMEQLASVEQWKLSVHYPLVLPGRCLQPSLALQFEAVSSDLSNQSWRLAVPTANHARQIVSTLRSLWKDQFGSSLAIAEHETSPSLQTATVPLADLAKMAAASESSNGLLTGWEVYCLTQQFVLHLAYPKDPMLYFTRCGLLRWSPGQLEPEQEVYVVLSKRSIFFYPVTQLSIHRSPESCTTFALADLVQVVVGLFDHSLRLEGRRGSGQTFLFLTRDSTETNAFLEHLVQVLSVQQYSGKMHPPLASPQSPRRSIYSRERSDSCNDAKRTIAGVDIFWPQTDYLRELQHVLMEASQQEQQDGHLLLYLRAFAYRGGEWQSCAVAITEDFLYICEEDSAHWPMPSFTHDIPHITQFAVLQHCPVRHVVKATVSDYGSSQVDLFLRSAEESSDSDVDMLSWRLRLQTFSQKEKLLSVLHGLLLNSYDRRLFVEKDQPVAVFTYLKQ